MRWYLVYRDFRTAQRDFGVRRWIIRAAAGLPPPQSPRHAG
jgi:LysR family glycine cleavage system transcriptional activator